jgi:predicted DNA-binding transcriptional regulator AlpA
MTASEPNPSKLLVSAAEAAKMLSMGRSTFWKAVGEKKLPQPVKIAGLTRGGFRTLSSGFSPPVSPWEPNRSA